MKNISTVKTENTNLIAERFLTRISQELGTENLTDKQKRLLIGYFHTINETLIKAEEQRMRKNDNNMPPVIWQNVDINTLAIDILHYSKIGLDMSQDNHLFAIPFYNRKIGKYVINLMLGYNGIQYIAMKYALKVPKNVTVELVYSTDVFKPIKKGVNQQYDSYEFIINSPFERGEVVGGFGYIEYEDVTQNKLIIMSKKDIEKRKPKYASPEFWGASGWYEEMCLKTLKRDVFCPKNIPIDPDKIDEHYQYVKQKELNLLFTPVSTSGNSENSENIDDTITINTEEIETNEL